MLRELLLEVAWQLRGEASNWRLGVAVAVWTLVGLVALVWWSWWIGFFRQGDAQTSQTRDTHLTAPRDIGYSGAGSAGQPSIGRRTSKKPKIAVALNDTLLRCGGFTAPEWPEQPISASGGAATSTTTTPIVPLNISLITESVEPFLKLCKICEVFPITRVQCDADEKRVLELLNEIKAFDENCLQHHRVLFSTTVFGRVQIVSQLQPMFNIETNERASVALKNKVPNLIKLRLADSAAMPIPPPTDNARDNSVSVASSAAAAASGYTTLKECVDALDNICNVVN